KYVLPKRTRFCWGSANLVDALLAGDEACAARVGEPRPNPIDEDRQAIAEADEKIDVDEAPKYPCEPARELDECQIRDRRGTTDGGERPLIAITKGSRWRCADDARGDELRHIAPFLLRHRCDARERLAMPIEHERGIADDED